MTFALRAFFGIDHKRVDFHRYRGIGAFELANTAGRALRRDDLIGHFRLLSGALSRANLKKPAPRRPLFQRHTG